MAAIASGYSRNLLILRPLSGHYTRQDLLSCHGEAIENALVETSQSLSKANSRKHATKRLDIAVLASDPHKGNRSTSFALVQSLFADLYSISVYLAAGRDIDLDFAGGVDVRIFVIDLSLSADQDSSAGPCIAVETFVASHPAYDCCWIPASSASDPSASHLDSICRSLDCQRIKHSPLSSKVSEPSDGQQSVNPYKGSAETHNKVAVGGTFDHLHIGHKLLLTATVFVAQPRAEMREITIGITGDELLVNKKHADVLESWEVRQHRVAEFVESILVFHHNVESIRSTEYLNQPGPNGKVVRVKYQPQSGQAGVTINYTQISDPFGPTITEDSISALVISAETRAGGKAVNDKRSDKGWKALEVFEVDVLDGSSMSDESGNNVGAEKTTFENKISSTEIRRRLTTPQS